MAAGDVTVNLVEDWTTTTLDTAVTAVRTAIGANGTWNMVSVNQGQDIVVVGIEEA